MSLNDKRFTSKCGWDVVQSEEVKKFIKEILKVLDDDFNERKKYLSEYIKQKAGKELVK